MLRLLFCVFLLCSLNTAAQTRADTSKLKIYHRLDELSNKKKVYRFIYKKVFRIPQSQQQQSEQCDDESCDIYRNRIIRDIQVITLEPFGYTVYDTTRHQHNFVQKAGNILHQRSTHLTIKNQLLIKKNTPLDPLKVKESERIIRQSIYVKDVIFHVVPFRRATV